MRSQPGTKLLLVLIVCSAYIFTFSHLGAQAFGSVLSNSGEFSEDTGIGPLEAGGLSKREAQTLLQEQFVKWKTETQFLFQYKEKTIPFDLAEFDVQITESVAAAVDGQQNPLIVKLKEEAVEAALLGLSADVSEVAELDLFTLSLKQAAGSLNTGQITFKVQDFIPENVQETAEIIAASEVNVQEGGSGLAEFTQKLPSLEVPQLSQTSLIKAISDRGLEGLTDYEVSIAATALYTAISQTNFEVVERHISRKIPEYAEPGFEARADLSGNRDFIFANPNEISYSAEFKWDAPKFTVEIKGTPLLYKYTLSVTDKQEFNPKIIRQYNPLLLPDQKTVETAGDKGLLILKAREIYDEAGQLVSSEPASEDFYPPTHRVEVSGFKPVEQVAPPAAVGSESVNVTQPGQNTEGSKPQAPDNGIAPKIPESGSSSSNSSGNNTPPVPGRTNEDDEFWGRSDDVPQK
ncbi:VanW family protein [Mesobacillus harenae]|uniref:VanW family protein n=1 Tax=Mesobacillus harenae TaxID=2213203 RepID=UPI00157FFC61